MQNYNSKFKTDLVGRCYRFSLDVIKLTDSLPNKRSAWVLADQLIRLTTSIGANLTEARASSSRLEFKRFYEISLKSANESKYWLELLGDSGLVAKDRLKSLLSELHELSSMIASSVLKLKSKKL